VAVVAATALQVQTAHPLQEQHLDPQPLALGALTSGVTERAPDLAKLIGDIDAPGLFTKAAAVNTALQPVLIVKL